MFASNQPPGRGYRFVYDNGKHAPLFQTCALGGCGRDPGKMESPALSQTGRGQRECESVRRPGEGSEVALGHCIESTAILTRRFPANQLKAPPRRGPGRGWEARR